ncbi:MAG: hypothetical protein ABS81_29070 [Pseudonocardia sp. SCN 72-86]|nr:MAG: hypothetical protein ABS81_29070 [Pseudonocardia sp. SCN 72-86]
MTAVIGGRILDAAAVEENIVLAIPSAALGRAWSLVDPEHHAALQVLIGLPNTVIDELSPSMAQESGLLMAASGQDDLVTGQVVAASRRRGWPAVTGDPGALRKMDGTVAIEELP